MAEESRKFQLSADLAQARTRIAANASALRRDLQFGRRLRAEFREHRAIWLGGACVLGLVLARLAIPPRKVVVKAPGRRREMEEKAVKTSLLLTGLKLAFDVARPALTKWLTKVATDYASNRARGWARR